MKSHVRPCRFGTIARVNTAHPVLHFAKWDSIGQQRIEMTALPHLRLIVELEAGLVGEELLRVELAPPVLDPDVVDLVKHLVEHDPCDEEPRDERAIERAVDADQAILDRVAAYLYRVAPARAAAARAPRDRGVDAVVEVARVELIEDRAQIVGPAGREDDLGRRAARPAADVPGVGVDEVAQDARRYEVRLH